MLLGKKPSVSSLGGCFAAASLISIHTQHTCAHTRRPMKRIKSPWSSSTLPHTVLWNAHARFFFINSHFSFPTLCSVYQYTYTYISNTFYKAPFTGWKITLLGVSQFFRIYWVPNKASFEKKNLRPKHLDGWLWKQSMNIIGLIGSKWKKSYKRLWHEIVATELAWTSNYRGLENQFAPSEQMN